MARTSWFVGGTLNKVQEPKKRPNGRRSRTVYDFDDDADGLLLIGAGASFIDPDDERDPPPPPTPVSFPTCETSPEQAPDQVVPLSVSALRLLFSRVMKPADISNKHLETLNIKICKPCTIDELLPPTADSTSYLPPLTPAEAMTPESYAVVSPVDQAESRKRRAFADRVVELRVDNDTAYRTLSRSVKAGVKAPRLSYMRKFWQGLESMSRYWDDSADHYYELPPAQLCSGRGVKRQRLDDTPVCHIDGSEPLSGTSTPTSAAMARSSPSKTDLLPTPTPSPERETQAGAGIEDECTPTVSSASNGADHGSRSATVSPEPRSRSRYRGRRTGTGRDMPDQFRADTACAFVEGVAMSFQCCITSPRVLPIVQFGGLKLPVRQTAAVYRMPADRTKARQGRLEGPVLTIQVRPEIEFVDKAGESLEPKARLDLMRELGALLQLAQERRREGKTEARPGVGKWWTSKPRWGGGDGYEPDGEGSAAYIVKATNELLDDIKAQKNGKQVVRKKATPALLWKELKCPSGIWDPKVDYMAIGKAPKSPYDEVFMVSSLNHHLSIVKLTVHQAYADSLVSGVQSETEPTNSRWCSPKLQRSEWFDLFDMQQRVEAFRAVWAVMAYLTRGTGSKAGKVG